MKPESNTRHTVVLFIMLAIVLTLLASPASGQQTYVTRYDVFAGYTFLDSPHVSLFENGFHFQAGVRPTTWYSLGFDYSISEGNLTLTPNLLTTTLQQQLGAELMALAAAGKIPPGYTLVVPVKSVTQTFAAGPQLAYRHFKNVTLFLRPDLGAIHEAARPQPAGSDLIAWGVVNQLAPTGKKTNWTPFYGFGGGVDLLFSKHLGFRIQSDLVYDHLFSDLLKDGRFTVRFSVGPIFNLGKNIKH
ncbi:MAG TPA: hypothetical protein VGZ29_14935 [Terriglobia bacterium]|nr:hypothetical protein [Terriglobia bacterium]